MSLNTGMWLHCNNWTPLPMGADDIARMEAMAKREGKPLLRGEAPLFEWRLGVHVNGGEDEPPMKRLRMRKNYSKLKTIIQENHL